MPSTSTGLAEEIAAPDEAAVVARVHHVPEGGQRQARPDRCHAPIQPGEAAGCVEAEFTVLDALPDTQRVGLFAQPRTYPAFIRFASAASASDREKDVRGMSIKVRDVRGKNLTAEETTQDFILNSHPVMMAAGTKEFLDLLQAVESGGLRRIL